MLLEEVLNPRDPGLMQGLNGELGFNGERFAPVHTDESESEETEEREDHVAIPA